MLYRVLILLILAILAGCGQQAETADTKTKPVQTSVEPPVSFKTYNVMDSANLEKFFEFDEKRPCTASKSRRS